MRKLLVYPILFQMTRGSFCFQMYCSKPNGFQETTQNVPKNELVQGDIWGSAWLLVIMNGPINQKLKQISICNLFNSDQKACITLSNYIRWGYMISIQLLISVDQKCDPNSNNQRTVYPIWTNLVLKDGL